MPACSGRSVGITKKGRNRSSGQISSSPVLTIFELFRRYWCGRFERCWWHDFNLQYTYATHGCLSRLHYSGVLTFHRPGVVRQSNGRCSSLPHPHTPDMNRDSPVISPDLGLSPPSSITLTEHIISAFVVNQIGIIDSLDRYPSFSDLK